MMTLRRKHVAVRGSSVGQVGDHHAAARNFIVHVAKEPVDLLLQRKRSINVFLVLRLRVHHTG